MSSCKAEYVAAASTVFEGIWLRNILKELDDPQEEPTMILVDNESAIQPEKNPIYHEGEQTHRYTVSFSLRHVKQKIVKLKYCYTLDQVTDIFTKPLSVDALED